jgi:hypothetical protein
MLRQAQFSREDSLKIEKVRRGLFHFLEKNIEFTLAKGCPG